MKGIKYFIKSFLTDNCCLFECLVLLCTTLNIVYMHIEIFDLSLLAYRFNVVSHFFTIFDVLAIYSLFLLFLRNKVKLLFIPYSISAIYILINVAYSRYFETYLPFSLYLEYNNLNGLTSNTLDAFEITDLFIVITSLILVIFYLLFLKNIKRGSQSIPYAFLLWIVLLFIVSIPVYDKYKKENIRLKEHFLELNDNRGVFTTFQDDVKATRITSSKDAFFKFGLFFNLIVDRFDSSNRVNEEDTQLLIQKLYPTKYVLPDTLKYKNTILILIESLSSFPIDLVIDGKEITPNINRLKENAYYNPNMISETKLGESSDGQYIYMTGLLPLKNKVTINEISNVKQIPSLPFFFKKEVTNLHVRMVIPTNEKSWSQNIMCSKYDIDTLYTRDHYAGDKNDWLTDKQLFELAIQIDEKLLNQHDNYMSIILTSSTHSPYNDCIEYYDFNFPQTYSLELRNYLLNVHYLDKCLGEYLLDLKKLGIFDETMIVIVADHKPNTPKLNMDNPTLCSNLPLIIVNSPVKISDERRILYQTTLFPTILDLFGVENNWRGVGKSLFMPDSLLKTEYEIERKNKEQYISDVLLYSEYEILKQ